MLSLRELQVDMMHAILDREFEAASAWVAPQGLSAAGRIGIYANNSRVGFISTLCAAFPVVLRLVGENYFRQCCRSYQRRFPSTSGDLQHAGYAFAEYLGELHANDRYRYLADVARLEWVYQEALIAADHKTFDLASLGAVAPERYGDIRFGLGASVQLLHSNFPILKIWQANQPGAEIEGTIALDVEANFILLHRFDFEVRMRRISHSEHTFLGAFAEGRSFGAAIASAEAADANFDATASLRQFVATQVITHFDPEILS
jgi:hypothetical protein